MMTLPNVGNNSKPLICDLSGRAAKPEEVNFLSRLGEKKRHQWAFLTGRSGLPSYNYVTAIQTLSLYPQPTHGVVWTNGDPFIEVTGFSDPNIIE